MTSRIFPIYALLALATTASLDAEPLAEILPEKLLTSSGEKVELSSLEGKYVGLYFSAHWCPPCRAFTPALVEFRNRHAEEGFEVVFVSFDNSNREKQNYMREAEMEWLTTRGARTRLNRDLAERYQIPGYPTLVILDPEGNLVTPDGKSDVMLSAETAFEKWRNHESS